MNIHDLKKKAGDLPVNFTDRQVGYAEGYNQAIDDLADKGLLMVWQPIEAAPKGKHDVFLVGGETETPCVVVNTSESYSMHKDYPFHTYYGLHPLPKDKFTCWMRLPKGDA